MNIRKSLKKAFAGVALAAALGGSFGAGYIVRSNEPNENIVAVQTATMVEPPAKTVETARVPTGPIVPVVKEAAETVKPVILTADEADLLYTQPRSQPWKSAMAKEHSDLGAVMNQTKLPILTADEADLLYTQPRIRIQWDR